MWGFNAQAKVMMNNPRITNRDLNNIKSALRRAFARSDLRERVLAKSRIDWHNPERPRVTKWSVCPVCNEKTPQYKMEVDHTIPLIPVDSSMKEMTLDTLVDRLWCEEENLQAMCETCHDKKTKIEMEERKLRRKEKKALEKALAKALSIPKKSSKVKKVKNVAT